MIYLRAFGVERYHDGKLPPVDFAENDACEIEDAWRGLGHELDSVLILSDTATKTRLESELNRLKGRVTEWDTIVLYYAGHGFHSNGRNRLSGTDTFLDALDETTIALEDVFRKITDLGAQKSMMFLDACHSGMELSGGSRSAVSAFSSDELRMYDKGVRAVAIFASCDTNQKSYPYPAEKHGYWTMCLLRALRGDVPEVLTGGELVYGIGLQEHLAREVPALIRRTSTTIEPQRPRAFMDFDQNFIVADLKKIMEARAATEANLGPIAESLQIMGTETALIQKLSGFRKGKHKIYEDVTPATKAFVVRIGSQEVQDLFDNVYEALHTDLDIDYVDLDADQSEEGFSIITPAFDVKATIDQNEHQATNYDITMIVDTIRDPAVIESPQFSQVFREHLDSIRIELSKAVNLGQLVKQLERTNLRDGLTYKPGTSISLKLPDHNMLVTITRDELTFKATQYNALDTLIAELPGAITALSAQETALALPGHRVLQPNGIAKERVEERESSGEP